MRALPESRWRAARWRDSKGLELASRLALVRVERADETGAPAGEQWLVAEWRRGQPEPPNLWLSTFTSFSDFLERTASYFRRLG